MKKAFHDIVVFLMAVLVLFSTTSFTVDKHYCGTILVDTSILSEAKTCGMEMHVESDATSSMTEQGLCCSNKKISVEGQDELKVSFGSLNLDQQIFLTTFSYSYSNLFRDLSQQQVLPYKNYSPPLLVTDIQVLEQVFLI